MSQKEYTKAPLPLVSLHNIKDFIGQFVIIHGKCISISNQIMTLQVTPDDQKREDILVNNLHNTFTMNSYLKVIGKVLPDSSIEFMDAFTLQDDFDLSVVNEIIPLLYHQEVAGMFF